MVPFGQFQRSRRQTETDVASPSSSLASPRPFCREDSPQNTSRYQVNDFCLIFCKVQAKKTNSKAGLYDGGLRDGGLHNAAMRDAGLN